MDIPVILIFVKQDRLYEKQSEKEFKVFKTHTSDYVDLQYT